MKTQLKDNQAISAEDWKLLNDVQKTQILLGTFRTFDQERFVTEFKSLEQPELIIEQHKKGGQLT